MRVDADGTRRMVSLKARLNGSKATGLCVSPSASARPRKRFIPRGDPVKRIPKVFILPWKASTHELVTTAGEAFGRVGDVFRVASPLPMFCSRCSAADNRTT
jgi:hypothetical protein